MIDHRRLQRTLFRMQMDPAFARAMRAHAATRQASGLGARELAWLDGLDPRAVSADRGGQRRQQLFGNATSEFGLSRVLLGDERATLEEFLSSPEFHAALAQDGRLPLAFGGFAERLARARGDALLAALSRLELALARARRSPERPTRAGVDELVLAPRAELVELPAGTFEQAGALRQALDAGRAPERPDPHAAREPSLETVLVLPRRTPARHALDDVHVERLEPGVAALLECARTPLDRAARARFALEHGATADELERFAQELADEGWLVRGPSPA